LKSLRLFSGWTPKCLIYKKQNKELTAALCNLKVLPDYSNHEESRIENYRMSIIAFYIALLEFRPSWGEIVNNQNWE